MPRGKLSSLGSAAITGSNSGLVVVANGENLEVTIPTDGDWQFVLDANDPAKPTLTIQPTELPLLQERR